MRKARRLAVGLALGLAALPLGAGARGAEDVLSRQVGGVTFDDFVAATLQHYEVAGAVVAVVRASGPVFLRGYGIRRRGASEPVDENTRFQLASLSKFIAATAVGTLVDRDVVAWDASIRSYSPDTVLAVPYATEHATLRDYFAHRTGLPAYTGDLLAQLGYDQQDLTRRAQYLPFDHSFRASWAYSNYGIFLGQTAAARAAGKTPAELLAGLFRELGMERSGPTQSELFKDENRAVAQNLDGRVMPYENVDAFSGAGAIVSTGADLARWMGMLLAKGAVGDRQVLKETTVNQIFAASMVQGPGGRWAIRTMRPGSAAKATIS